MDPSTPADNNQESPDHAPSNSPVSSPPLIPANPNALFDIEPLILSSSSSESSGNYHGVSSETTTYRSALSYQFFDAMPLSTSRSSAESSDNDQAIDPQPLPPSTITQVSEDNSGRCSPQPSTSRLSPQPSTSRLSPQPSTSRISPHPSTSRTSPDSPDETWEYGTLPASVPGSPFTELFEEPLSLENFVQEPREYLDSENIEWILVQQATEDPGPSPFLTPRAFSLMEEESTASTSSATPASPEENGALSLADEESDIVEPLPAPTGPASPRIYPPLRFLANPFGRVRSVGEYRNRYQQERRQVNIETCTTTRSTTEQDCQDICVICINRFQLQEDVREAFCSHYFHIPCIDAWFKISQLCPICRADFVVDAAQHRHPEVLEEVADIPQVDPPVEGLAVEEPNEQLPEPIDDDSPSS